MQTAEAIRYALTRRGARMILTDGRIEMTPTS